MDKQPTQASGGDGNEGRDDGVQDAPGKRAGGGESSGGSYPAPGADKGGDNGGFTGHGGQHDIDYSGPGDADDPSGGGDNAMTR